MALQAVDGAVGESPRRQNVAVKARSEQKEGHPSHAVRGALPQEIVRMFRPKAGPAKPLILKVRTIFDT
jgi:hypothetical protein